jgi:hypothetical protein
MGRERKKPDGAWFGRGASAGRPGADAVRPKGPLCDAGSFADGVAAASMASKQIDANAA